MNLPTTLTGITIIGSTLHWDIYPQLNIVKIPLKKLFSLVLTIQDKQDHLMAHAWVRCGEMIVMGQYEKDHFIEVAKFSNESLI